MGRKSLREESFKKTVWNFYHTYKRNLPWRETTDPYHILVSEIMLQQTQVARVLIKYPQFIHTFPSLQKLAQSSVKDVLRMWQGMGYNRRALYLREAARIIAQKYKGIIPDDCSLLDALPGIGQATSASIVVFTFNKPIVFIETNIRRVFIHHFFADADEVRDKEILPLVKQTLDYKYPRNWYFALMDYGSYLGKTLVNPNRKSSHYTAQSAFEGSRRQLRGNMIRLFLNESHLIKTDIYKKLKKDKKAIDLALNQLVQEGFIKQQGESYGFNETNTHVDKK